MRSKPGPTKPGVVLRLYIAGDAANSLRALDNLRVLCEDSFPEGTEVEVIDVLDDPLSALQEGILVTPTLVKLSPGPRQQVVGDLSNRALVLCAIVKRSNT